MTRNRATAFARAALAVLVGRSATERTDIGTGSPVRTPIRRRLLLAAFGPVLLASQVFAGTAFAIEPAATSMACAGGAVVMLAPSIPNVPQWSAGYDAFFIADLYRYSSSKGWVLHTRSDTHAAESLTTGSLGIGGIYGTAGPWWTNLRTWKSFNHVMFVAPVGYHYAVKLWVRDSGNWVGSWASYVRNGRIVGTSCYM